MDEDGHTYPPTIEGSLLIVASGDRFPLLARLLPEPEEVEGMAMRVYLVGTHDGGPIPATGADFERGRVAFEMDLLPAQSLARLPFTPRSGE